VSTEPRESKTASADRRALRRWVVLLSAGFFATTMAQPAVLRLPIQNLLKGDLHVSREAMASFFAISTLAWYFKPLAGILSDSVPLFGTRRRHYLLLSAIAAGAFWALVGLVPRHYGAILAAVIAMNAMLVMGSTVSGGVMVEAGQRYGASGRLSSARYFVMNACTLIGGPLGGFLAARAFGYTAAVGAVISLSVVPFAWWLLREPPVTEKNWKAWTEAKTQFHTLMRSRTLWSAAGLMFLVYIMPGFATPLYYFQTDTLKLSQQFIGTLILLAGGFGLLGAVIYGFLCRRTTLRWMLIVSIALGALSTLGYLFYRSGTDAAVIESVNGLLGTLAPLALMDLAVRATPRGSESLGFSLMMSVTNIGMALSDITGSWLIDHHFATFFNLVWLNAGTTALVLLVIPFLPSILIDRPDEAPAAVVASVEPARVPATSASDD
jgi:predicted MFS family arabinose efflux permease